AYQNRFEHTIKNINVSVENLSASESRIRDTDMAQEMVSFTRAQILSQAGTSMLAQANQIPQGVLSLLRSSEPLILVIGWLVARRSSVRGWGSCACVGAGGRGSLLSCGSRVPMRIVSAHGRATRSDPTHGGRSWVSRSTRTSRPSTRTATCPTR